MINEVILKATIKKEIQNSITDVETGDGYYFTEVELFNKDIEIVTIEIIFNEITEHSVDFNLKKEDVVLIHGELAILRWEAIIADHNNPKSMSKVVLYVKTLEKIN